MRRLIVVAVALLVIVTSSFDLTAAALSSALVMQPGGTPDATQSGTPAGDLSVPQPPASTEELDGTAAQLLGLCPCEPVERERFHHLIYPSGLPMAPAPDPGWDSEQREEEIVAELEARFAERPDAVRELAQDTFREAAGMMDIRLAAGLAMLAGTSGEPAIEVLLAKEWDSLGFGPITRPGWTVETDADDRWDIIISQDFQHEHFIWFSSILFHEAMHATRGDGAGREEEAVAAFLQRIVLAELLNEYPDVAAQNTSLSRSQLTFVLALLYNSDSTLQARGDSVYPGSPVTTASLWDAAPINQHESYDTIAPAALATVLDSLGVDAADLPDIDGDGVPDFTMPLLERLDVVAVVDAEASRLDGSMLQRVGERALTIDFFPPEPTPTPSPSPTPAFDASGLNDLLDDIFATAAPGETPSPGPTDVVPTPVAPPTSGPQSTSTQAPQPTATRPAPTQAPPRPTATRPPPTAVPPRPTATRPPPPPPTATRPPPTQAPPPPTQAPPPPTAPPLENDTPTPPPLEDEG